MNIAFVTSEQWPDLTEDDRLAAARIAQRGARVAAAVWTREHDWARFDLIVLRSCWDYPHRIDQFRRWIDELRNAGARVMNPVGTVSWNLDKRYLLDLAEAGARVIETELPAGGAELSAIIARRGWSTAVMKPRISADGHGTTVVRAADAAMHQPELDRLMAGPGALVQEYVAEIATSGELSLIFLGGAYSHCVRKLPTAGDFRVQSRFGGTAEPFAASTALIEQASAVLRAANRECGYARVDGCVMDGRLALMELELIEPSLFLDCDAGAAARFADVILDAAC